jgi:ribosomal subunit interface protein
VAASPALSVVAARNIAAGAGAAVDSFGGSPYGPPRRTRPWRIAGFAAGFTKGQEMRIQVSGKQLDVGEALRSHAEEKLLEIVGKYAERPVEANVTFSRDAYEFTADVSVHLSTGLTVQAKSKASEIYAALDGAIERMEKQLRRYKRRLKDHHRARELPIESFGAPSYILAGSPEGPEEEPEPADLQPVIVAETETKVLSLSVGEAVMQMELAGAPLLVFRNTAHGGVNVVYMRDDGNIGWIDPRNA